MPKQRTVLLYMFYPVPVPNRRSSGTTVVTAGLPFPYVGGIDYTHTDTS